MLITACLLRMQRDNSRLWCSQIAVIQWQKQESTNLVQWNKFLPNSKGRDSTNKSSKSDSTPGCCGCRNSPFRDTSSFRYYCMENQFRLDLKSGKASLQNKVTRKTQVIESALGLNLEIKLFLKDVDCICLIYELILNLYKP